MWSAGQRLRTLGLEGVAVQTCVSCGWHREKEEERVGSR